MVIDFEDISASGVANEIENANYGNDCISPKVMRMETREIEWSDEHPLNKWNMCNEAYHKLFSEEPETGICRVCPLHCKLSELRQISSNTHECRKFTASGKMMEEETKAMMT